MEETGQKKAVFSTKTKICFIVALCLMVFVNALSAQDVTLKFSKVPVKTVLKAIEKQTDYSFVYSNSVDVEKNVSVDVENQELRPVLSWMFNEVGIAFQISGKQIVLSPTSAANKTKGASTSPSPNAKSVKGVVKDESGVPLEGASVLVKNKEKYALTNAAGEFNLDEVEAGDMLTVFYVGFEPADIHVGGATSFDVKLVSDAAMLDGALVTGYTTLSRERATGAFNRVGSEVIGQRRASDLSSALLGTVAGMQGKENTDGTINYIIRGTTSLYADAAPLVVVDGFPVANGFRDVNPNDVENITVLKDAAAASIWGARSANGVIVITTKKASAGSGQGKNVNINVNAMVKIGDKLDLETALTTASSKDHVYYEKLAFDNNWIFSSGYVDDFATSILNAPLTLVSEQIYDFKRGRISEAQLDATLELLSEINNRQQIKDLLLQRPILQQYNLTVSNSNNNVRNYLSALYEHGKGNVIENQNNRWRINYNNQMKVFKWLDFSLSTNLHLLRNTTSGPTIAEMRELSPYEMILNPDGSYAEQLKINREQRAKIPAGQLPYEDWTYNILREARARDITSEQFNTRVQAGLTFKFMDGVKFTSSIQYEYNKSQSRDLQREDSFYTRNLINTWIDYTHDKDDPSKSKRNKQLVPKGAILKNQRSTGENYVWRNQLDFDRTFGGKHQVAAAAGFEMQEYKTNSQRDPWIFGHNPDKNSTGYINLNPSSPQEKDIKGTVPYYTFGSAGSGILLTPSLGYRLDRYVSVYGNASYTFAGKYSVTGSARSDASNLIADDASYRWAPLWSVGGKWNVSQENFMQPTASWLDRLSLRLTYGFNGNVEKSTSHKTLVGRSTTPSATFGGLYIGTVTMGNPDLRWEKTSSINAAIDFALLNNTVFGSIDFYSKRGKDIIGNKALPSVLGATALRINNAEISNKGVEIEIGVNTKLYEEVRFTGKLTYAYNDNKITNLYDPNIYAYSMFEGAYVEGYPVGALWGYNYLGMENGVPYVEGIGGLPSTMNDVAIHNRALGSLFLKYAGPSIAPHTLGLHAGFSGYGFSLSVFINGTFGGHFRNPTFDYNMVGASKVIIPYFVNEVIKGSKKLPSWPAPSETKAYLWNRYVPNLLTMVEKSSFIKVKEINLEYSLPKQWTDFVGTGNVRVFAQVRDLGCLWVANSRGYDPEWLPGTMKPATTYAFGVNLNF